MVTGAGVMAGLDDLRELFQAQFPDSDHLPRHPAALLALAPPGPGLGKPFPLHGPRGVTHPAGSIPAGSIPVGFLPPCSAPLLPMTREDKGSGDLGSALVTQGQVTCPSPSRSDQLVPCPSLIPSHTQELGDVLGSGGHREPSLPCSPRRPPRHTEGDLVIPTPRNNLLAGRSSSPSSLLQLPHLGASPIVSSVGRGS